MALCRFPTRIVTAATRSINHFLKGDATKKSTEVCVLVGVTGFHHNNHTTTNKHPREVRGQASTLKVPCPALEVKEGGDDALE